eukprot:GHRR01032559.1.p1 GENE.GHRR01032559.1~~GHRR01032559.1.p1  ORF type:complete len:143 (-),score=21.62 GHRR01032559.1:135-563(-)
MLLLPESGTQFWSQHVLDAMYQSCIRHRKRVHLLPAAGSVLADPMCGSGTFLIEAALIATNAAPGLLRNSSTMIGRPPHHIWPFMGWHDYDDWQWQLLLNAAQQRAEQGQHHWNQSGGQLLGNDISKVRCVGRLICCLWLSP